MKKKKKFIVIVSHPIQYHAILWRSIAEVEDLDFEVWFCSDHGQKKSLDKDFGVEFKWDVPLTEGYQYRFFKNFGFGSGFFKYINPGLIWSLIFKKRDFIYFHGVNNFTAYFSFWLAKFRKSKTILRIIAHNLDQNVKEGFKRKLRDLIYGTIFRKSSVCLYIGKHNKDFYKSFRVKDGQLIHAPHIVDNDFFQNNKLNALEKRAFKKKNNVESNSLVLLFCGKLIPKKQPEMLLEAFSQSDFDKNVTLLFAGDGSLKDNLQINASEINKTFKNKNIVFLGFQNQTQLPSIYSISDVLVLPSYHQETWGLVVNESLNFSCAAIVSDNVGCGPELVQNKTGFIFDRNDQSGLQNVLEQLVNNDDLLTKYKQNSQSVIDNWSNKEFVRAIKNIVNG